MDIFKAIFASDDEDSDDEEELAKSAPAVRKGPAAPPPPPPPVSTSDNSIPVSTASHPPTDVAAQSSQLLKETADDASSFKPVFQSKSVREGGSKTKPEKKKKKAKVVVSFDMDDGESAGVTVTKEIKKRSADGPGEREGKKGVVEVAKKPRIEPDVEEEDLWVEKVSDATLMVSPDLKPPASVGVGAAGKKNRPSASDFL